MSDTTHPDEKYGPAQNYFGSYQPSQDVRFFSNLNESTSYSAMTTVSISLIINDNNYTSDAQPYFDLIALDSDYDPFTKYIIKKRYYELTTPAAIKSTSEFDNSISMMNIYSLSLKQFYQFGYHRKIEEFIRPSWMNDFGIPPSYDNKSYIESTLGLIGGACGFATAIYALLFGASQLRPWGIVQLYCCGFSRLTQKKLMKTLPMIPFFDTSYTNIKNDDSSDHDLSLAEKNEIRIKSLELFLQEYVVDVNYLNNI
ncbi:hypothetical protein RclHR1_05970019 [Rhizophagus clarus]|nr:hypothetical protein RclHR1_05970019 [Rhizophagus clarus]